MPTSKEDAEELMNNLLPLAKQLLTRHQEFYPYGGYMTSDGKITHVGGKIDGTDHPASQPIINLLKESFKYKARSEGLRTTAIIFDVRIKPPGEDEKTDAIQVCLDHRDGYSVEVLFPYKMVAGELLLGKKIAQRGDARMFERS